MVSRKEIADLLGAVPCQRCGRPEALEDLIPLLCYRCHLERTSAVASYMDPIDGVKFERDIKEFLSKRVVNGEIPE